MRFPQINFLREQLKRHEGVELMPYKDSEGYLTIGCGRNLDANGITIDEAMIMLDHDIVSAIREAERIPGYEKCNDARRAVLVNMTFNMGLPTIMKFRRMIAAIQAERWSEAAGEMLDSKWAKQVKGRAVELSEMMASGDYPA